MQHEVPAKYIVGARGEPEVHGYCIGLVGDHGGGGKREVGYWGLGGSGWGVSVLGQGDLGEADEYSR